MEVSLWLLVHPSLRRVARVRTVLDAVARALARQRPLVEGRAPDPDGPSTQRFTSPTSQTSLSARTRSARSPR